MKKKFRKSANLLISLIVSITMLFPGIQPSSVSAQAQAQNNLRRDRNAETGKATLISGVDNKPISVLGQSAVNIPQAEAAGATWYVSTIGNNSNNCITPVTPCATIVGALGKLTSGDTIYVEQGIYNNLPTLINKSVTISGGWNSGFNAQTGDTILDRSPVTINDGDGSQTKVVIIDHLAVRNGFYDAGITNWENLTITNCEIYNNTSIGIPNWNIITIDNCRIHNNYGGIRNNGSATITNSDIYENSVDYGSGGGIDNNSGTLTVSYSRIYRNTAYYGGGGIRSSGDATINATINNSAIYENSATHGSGGGIGGGSGLFINNSTISRNVAQNGGGVSGGTLYNTTVSQNTAQNGGGVSGGTLYNSTVTENTAQNGGAIYGEATLYNSIIANNSAVYGVVCSLSYSNISPRANNIIYKNNCSTTMPTGQVPDFIDIDPKLNRLIFEAGYAPLASNSPAINAGDPSTCIGATDQRGMPRVGICDIGAYEYATPGLPSQIYYVSGDKQRAPSGTAFSRQFSAVVLDANGSPVGAGITIIFSAPAAGPSGVFASSGTNEETIQTSESGFATSSVFTANNQSGNYTVTASASGTSNAAIYNVGNGFWAITPGGNDSNNCLSAFTPCASIAGVLAKPNFYDGDHIRLLVGTYNTYLPLHLDNSVTISGGWNSAFTAQTGISIVKHEFIIYSPGNATIERIIIESGPYEGISNEGVLLFQDGGVRNSQGVTNTGILIIKNSTISGNTSSGNGGGIRNGGSGIGAKVTIINSTISSNSAPIGGAIYNSNSYSSTVIEIYNSTITNNIATYMGSGGIEAFGAVGSVILSNTIVAGNISPGFSPVQDSTTFSPDCRGTFTSLGNNLIGNIGILNAASNSYPCHPTFTASDMWGDNTTPIPASIILDPLTDFGNGARVHPLRLGSPAIDAGSPLDPGTPNSNACPSKDQRGVERPQGLRCDIGSFEFDMQPVVRSITRASANPTNLTSVNFAVTFSESATSVDTGDFILTTTAGISSATVSGVSGSGKAYTATVNTGSGDGTIRLDVVDDNSIVDGTSNPLGGAAAGDGNFTTGEVYIVNKSSVFADVPLAYWANTSIERLYNASITGGCMTVPLSYCPTTPVTRAQMTIFLLRGMHGSTYTPPAATGTKFNDVPLGTFGAAWIEQLAVEGISSGCGNGNYCPTTPVSRAQMAIFLVRAKHGIAFTPPTATGIFTDVPIGSFGADYIEQLSADGITSGCGSTNFCPNTIVKRDSMAVFLVKTFNLP